MEFMEAKAAKSKTARRPHRRRNTVLAVIALTAVSVAVGVLVPTLPVLLYTGVTIIFFSGVVTGLTWKIN
jgi:VIT1/CCC1 family predicted Fe2+/Mn2+ transporter